MDKKYKILNEEGGQILISEFLQNFILESCNRVEVIEERTGRVYVNRNEDNIVRLLFQDENRTLKIFISKNK